MHDSGLERAHVADLAELLAVPFASIGPGTVARLIELLDPGLVPANPLDVWGTGAATRDLFAGSLMALADDPAVDAIALAVDLVPELDLDQAYPLALLETSERTSKPLAILSNLASGIDPEVAGQLRAQGVAVLEGTRSGLLALRHLLDHGYRAEATAAEPPANHGHRATAAELPADPGRRARGAALLASGQASGAAMLSLLADYGMEVTQSLPAADAAGALAAAGQIGYPVVLKTDEPRFQHKSDVGGVLLGIGGAGQLAAGVRGSGRSARPARAGLADGAAGRGAGARYRDRP